MKRSEFEQHLRRHGCRLAREGAKHSIWENPTSGSSAAVPRHGELKRGTVRRICIDLDIPQPWGR